MLKGENYNGLYIDIWSCGIILYYMLTGNFPFYDNDGNNISLLYKKIIEGRFNIPNYLSLNAKDLIKKILVTNPKKRIKINGILKHPWFNLIDKKYNYHEGINININIIPIDEDIIFQIKKLIMMKILMIIIIFLIIIMKIIIILIKVILLVLIVVIII